MDKQDLASVVPGFGWSASSFCGWMLLFATIVLLGRAVDPRYLDPQHQQFIFLLGVIGIWRYGNAIMHFLRSMYFLHWVFPRLRRVLTNMGRSALPSHIYMVVTSFRIPAPTTFKVYRSVFQEVERLSVPATIIVSIVEKADEVFIKDILRREVSQPERVKLVVVRARGTGKRDGLAHAFRALSRMMPADDAVVGVVDGDTQLLPGCVEKAVSVFSIFPDVGGVTTNEFCEVEGGPLMQQWHALRFVQRHVAMCSMSLSKRVLTMTGRLSFFRAPVLTSAEFIRDVEQDHLFHWRLGRFQFLTGDDKSSWFGLMRSGWSTYYVPDSLTLTVEHPPEKSFLKATRQLMYRWYGNSLRQNFRTTKLLGREQLGLFTLYVLYDQRVSMWTCLLGMVSSVVMALLFGPEFLFIYLLWVLMTRTIATLLYGLAGHAIHPLFPLVLYYNQVVGSVMKIYTLFHMDRQSWTRQKTTLADGASGIDIALNRFSSKAMLFSSVSLFSGAVAVLIALSQRGY